LLAAAMVRACSAADGRAEFVGGCNGGGADGASPTSP
jgi:hypothetical protein